MNRRQARESELWRKAEHAAGADNSVGVPPREEYCASFRKIREMAYPVRSGQLGRRPEGRVHEQRHQEVGVNQFSTPTPPFNRQSLPARLAPAPVAPVAGEGKSRPSRAV